MNKLLSQDQADKLYAYLLDLHMDNNQIRDKLHNLRAKFDLALDWAYSSLSIKNEESVGFKGKIDAIFPPDSPEENVCKMNKLLNNQRWFLNTQLAHTAEKEERRMRGAKTIVIDKKVYRQYLQNMSEMIAMISGIPIPSKLIHAYNLPNSATMSKKMDVVILFELFDRFENIDDGMKVLHQMNSWIKNRETVGLDKLTIHIVMYSAGILFYNGTRTGFVEKLGTNAEKALCEALFRMEIATNKRKNNETKYLKPWLIWICQDIKTIDFSGKSVEKLQESLKKRQFSFYPLVMQQDDTDDLSSLHFKEGHKPDYIVAGLAENLFNSISETIMRIDKRKS